MKQGSATPKCNLCSVILNAGDSKTKSLIRHLKPKHRIHVILESEDHKTIPAQEEIRLQTVKKEMSLFEAKNRGPINLKNCSMPLFTIKPHQWNQRDFSAMR